MEHEVRIIEELNKDEKTFIEATLSREEIESYKEKLKSGILLPGTVISLREPRSETVLKVRANVFSSTEIFNIQPEEQKENEYHYLDLSASSLGQGTEYILPDNGKRSQPFDSQLPMPQQDNSTSTSQSEETGRNTLPVVNQSTHLDHKDKNILNNNSSSSKLLDFHSHKSIGAFWKKWKWFIIVGIILLILLFVGVIVLIAAKKKSNSSDGTAISTTPPILKTTIIQNGNRSSTTVTTHSSQAISATSSPILQTTTIQNGNKSSTTVTSHSSQVTLTSTINSNRPSSATSTTMKSSVQPTIGPCVTFGSNRRICPTSNSAELTHTQHPSSPIATVGIDVVKNFLLLTWQDIRANEIYLSTIDTEGTMQSWPTVDQKLMIAENEVEQACPDEHICTTVGINQRCNDPSCSQQYMTQFCCSCGGATHPGCGVICSTPPLANQDPAVFVSDSNRPLVGTGRTIPGSNFKYVYFTTATTCKPTKLTDYIAVTVGDSFHPNGYTFPNISICPPSISCTILSMSYAVVSSHLFFGAVVRTSNQMVYFCEFNAAPFPSTEPAAAFRFCTNSPLSIKGDPTRLSVAIDTNNKFWYIIDTNADGSGQAFVVYFINRNGAAVEISPPIDFIRSSWIDSKINTYVGHAVFKNSLYIVLGSPNMEHIVTKYALVE